MVVSWASFLVPPEIIPGRMAMLITLFLVLTNIFNVSYLYEYGGKNMIISYTLFFSITNFMKFFRWSLLAPQMLKV